MKTHSTNYTDTFITSSEDSPAMAGEIPPFNPEKKSVAWMQYEILNENPYRFTSDDVLFQVYAERNQIPEGEWGEARVQFFSKGQPCFRASPLTKRYGWGIHNNSEGRVALFGRETDEYRSFELDPGLKVVKAVRSKRA